jgi:hypothetical protein
MQLVAQAELQREAVVAIIDDRRELAGRIETGIAFLRWAAAHKLLLLAGVAGFALARPRRLVRWAGQAWAIYRLVRSIRRTLGLPAR